MLEFRWWPLTFKSQVTYYPPKLVHILPISPIFIIIIIVVVIVIILIVIIIVSIILSGKWRNEVQSVFHQVCSIGYRLFVFENWNFPLNIVSSKAGNYVLLNLISFLA